MQKIGLFEAKKSLCFSFRLQRVQASRLKSVQSEAGFCAVLRQSTVTCEMARRLSSGYILDGAIPTRSPRSPLDNLFGLYENFFHGEEKAKASFG